MENEFGKGMIIVGDTHGNHHLIMHKIKALQLTDETLLHVGDFGVGFKDPSLDRADLRKLNNLLADKNCQMYVIRGNHDNPACFQGNWDWSNLHLVPDYTVVEINGDKVLMVGGAISIDRVPRKKNMLASARVGRDIELYWFDEAFVLDEEKLKSLKGIRYVVTHSCPGVVSPINDYNNQPGSHGGFVESFCYNDPKLKDDLNKERQDLTKMYEILKENNCIQAWFYGHFHRKNEETYEQTDFITLDIDQFYNVRQ